MSLVSIFERKGEVKIVDYGYAIREEDSLKKEGWNHIRNIDPIVSLQRIHHYCKEGKNEFETLENIVNLFYDEF